MVTVSHLVKNIVKERPLLHEAIVEDIVSFGSIAEKIKPDIEKELDKKVKISAIVMALRRHSEKLKRSYPSTSFSIGQEIVMKTDICDFTINKNPTIIKKLDQVHELIDYSKRDMLNIIHGNYESSIIINKRFKKKVKEILGKDIINFEDNLVSLSFQVSDEFIRTPGVIAGITRKLLWEGINIIEIITTCTEINVIVQKQFATKCYNALEEIKDN